MLLRWIFLLAMGFGFSLAQAQPAEKDFSSWRKFTRGQLIAATDSVAPHTSARIGLLIELEDKWHTYWVNPGDSGTPLRLTFHNSPGVKVKSVQMPVPERFTSGPLISFAYAKRVLFPIELEILEPKEMVQITAEAEWLVCDEVCLPANDTFVLELPVTSREEVGPNPQQGMREIFERPPNAVPKNIGEIEVHLATLSPELPAFQDNESIVELPIPNWKASWQFVDFFPFRGSGVTNDKPRFLENRGKPVLRFQKANIPRSGPERVGVLVVKDKNTELVQAIQYGEPNWSFTATVEGAATGNGGGALWWMLISAFLGGLILNLMPCVFPILSIKLLSLLKVSKSSAAIIRQQNLGYVAGVMLSFLGVALVLSGLRTAGHLVGWGFQLQSPVFLTFLCWLFFLLALNLIGLFEIEFIDAGIGGKWTRLGGFWGSFFTGVLAVVVASPCTAPFMGVALGFGLSQPTPILVAVFLTLGFGLAFPYALMIVVPSALWFLPKPGPWMVRMKQILAVPLLLTVVWLSWVLSQIAGLVAAIAVLGGCALLLASVLSPIQRSLLRATTLVLLIGLMAYINRGAQVAAVEAPAALEGEWKPFSEKIMADMKGRNVFVNMTADWCLTCKVNERLIFSQPDVLELLKSKNINLIMGDWTQRNAEITRFLNSYKRVGVPFYVVFSQRHPEGLVLPEVMTKSTFMELIRNEFP